LEIRNNSEIDLCFILPRSLRAELSKPYGVLFINENKLKQFLINKSNSRLITVGDVVTQTILKFHIKPFLAIVDGKTKRKLVKENFGQFEYIKVKNEPGLIRLSTIREIKDILVHNENDKILMVDGEEDLLVIPVVIYGNFGDIIIYGQPNAGVVVTLNNDFLKRRVLEIFKKFQVTSC